MMNKFLQLEIVNGNKYYNAHTYSFKTCKMSLSLALFNKLPQLCCFNKFIACYNSFHRFICIFSSPNFVFSQVLGSSTTNSSITVISRTLVVWQVSLVLAETVQQIIALKHLFPEFYDKHHLQEVILLKHWLKVRKALYSN